MGFLESLLGPSTFTVGYLAGGAPNSPLEGEGIFNGDYAVLGQVNFNVSDTFALGFTYVNGFHKSNSPVFGAGAGDGIGIVGTTLANQSNSQLNNLIGSEFPGATVDQNDKVSNSYGSQVAWRVSKGISFSAYFNYTNLTMLGRSNSEIWSYGGGVAFPDLFKEGSFRYLCRGSTL
jgi:hypothetical protein